MDFAWGLFIDLGAISAALLAATAIRHRVRFFQRYLIPNALTAGFLLLPFYNYVAPHLGLGSENLGEFVYHLLSLSFISMTLRAYAPQKSGGDGRIFATTIATLWQFGVQAVVGLLCTYLFMITFMPDLFPGFGFLLPLGFVQGPGQAFAIGSGWARFGFAEAGSIGLTFAAMGFIFATFGGVFLINIGIRRNWLTKDFLRELDTSAVKSGIFPSRKRRPVGAEMTTESEAIDSFTFHIALVFTVYLIAYLLLFAITSGLTRLGPLFADLAINLWGINFIFSALTAILVRNLMRRTGLDFAVDNKTLTRISGLSVDIMVAAAIGAISIVIVRAFLIPILFLSVVAGVLALWLVPWFCSRIFTDHQFHRTMMIYGVSTGTLPTGLALLRVIDPEFETPVASDYMYASGITFVFAIPFILSINLPAYAATTGNMLYFWAGVAVSGAYVIFVLAAFFIIARRRAFTDKRHIWLHPTRGEETVSE
ncbi:MAG: sodium:glutamate symporter [Spirochaetales bacterium]|nr:sodium:glutamate symporter [Spirochaetales bacterium]